MSGKPAARVNDPTACPLPGHGNSPITAGSPDVLIENMAAARQGDPTACGATLVGALSTTVFINGKPAALLGSSGTHGNTITAGAGTVFIGDTLAQAASQPTQSTHTFNRTIAISFSTKDSNGEINYSIIASGMEKNGKTSKAESMETISTGTQRETVTIYIYGE